MSQRDTIDGKTGAESILTSVLTAVSHMPEAHAFHARAAVYDVSKLCNQHLFQPSATPYAKRLNEVAKTCFAKAEQDYQDRYAKQTYMVAFDAAIDFYVAIVYHENMSAPLPF